MVELPFIEVHTASIPACFSAEELLNTYADLYAGFGWDRKCIIIDVMIGNPDGHHYVAVHLRPPG